MASCRKWSCLEYLDRQDGELPTGVGSAGLPCMVPNPSGASRRLAAGPLSGSLLLSVKGVGSSKKLGLMSSSARGRLPIDDLQGRLPLPHIADHCCPLARLLWILCGEGACQAPPRRVTRPLRAFLTARQARHFFPKVQQSDS